jgi:hypothetical protein
MTTDRLVREQGRQRRRRFRWVEGPVNKDDEHLVITYLDELEPVASIGKGQRRTFVVQFEPRWRELDDDSRNDIKRGFDFYLIDLGERDPWAYAIYHGGTTANVYSPVHWRYVPRRQRTPS